MRKLLLTTAVLGLTATTMWAGKPGSKYATAIEAQAGENKYSVSGDVADSVVWKFTPDKDYVAKVGPLAGSYDYVYVSTIKKNADTQEEEAVDLNGASAGSSNKYYPFSKGVTYYMTMVKSGEAAFNLTLEETDDLSGGLSADAPVVLSTEHTNYLGDPYYSGYYSYNTYSKFTATETGLLTLKSIDWNRAVVGETSYTSEYFDGTYLTKIPVVAEQTYDITVNTYNPICFQAEMSFPETGSLDVPFEMKEGENTVPADNKDYYYTYTPTTTGYMTISSESSLPGGCVKIYDSKSSIQYSYVKAQSEKGSYNVRAEITYIPSSPFYIVVSRTDKAEADETFTLTMESYKEGETEDTPIAIDEVPAEKTIPTATGSYFYSVKVPANTNKFLHVETGLGTSASYGTLVAVYPQGSSAYSGKSGYDNIDVDVTNTEDQVYIIKVTSNESTPITFKVSYKDISKGDLATNPEDAVLGENKITSNGTRYYKYTPTKDCKLVVTATPDMEVSFPMGTGMWDGSYDAVQSGVDFYFAATSEKEYLIKLENCKVDDVFTLAESEFKAGETREKPAEVDGEYTLTPTNATNLWLSHTAKKDGILTIYTDVPYNYNNYVEYGKSTAEYLSMMIFTNYDGSESKTEYKATLAVTKGDVVLVHTQFKDMDKDYTITFVERDYQEGETADMPIVLEEGKTVTIPAASRNNPVWLKAKLGVGTAEFTATDYASGYIYKGVEDAKKDLGEGTYGTYCSFSGDYSSTDVTYKYTKDVAEGEEGEYYFYIINCYNKVDITMTKSNDDTTGISTVNENGNVNGKVDVYSINGTKVATAKDINSVNLKAGVYVIISNGNAKKIVVK